MIVGSRRVSGTSRYFAKASALEPLPRYSTQPEESTTYFSESLSVVTVLILPLHALGDAAEVFDGSGLTEANTAVEYASKSYQIWVDDQSYDVIPDPVYPVLGGQARTSVGWMFRGWR